MDPSGRDNPPVVAANPRRSFPSEMLPNDLTLGCIPLWTAGTVIPHQSLGGMGLGFRPQLDTSFGILGFWFKDIPKGVILDPPGDLRRGG